MVTGKNKHFTQHRNGYFNQDWKQLGAALHEKENICPQINNRSYILDPTPWPGTPPPSTNPGKLELTWNVFL